MEPKSLLDPATGLPNPDTELPTAQELADYASAVPATKATAEAAIVAKAERWFFRNQEHLQVAKDVLTLLIVQNAPAIVAARYYHPKLDGRANTGNPIDVTTGRKKDYYPKGIKINAQNNTQAQRAQNAANGIAVDPMYIVDLDHNVSRS